ncbi:AI-2E family transporter [Cnuibacter sp. UC19_7]|uniref:AI-2E family transporter n=1 Tax=Cnuibacter sp. UC19_7 TaxID=3350166 RepID=UPI00366D2BAE
MSDSERPAPEAAAVPPSRDGAPAPHEGTPVLGEHRTGAAPSAAPTGAESSSADLAPEATLRPHATYAHPSLRSLWTGRLGVVATRSLQVLLVLAVVSVLVIGLVQVKLVVLPVLIAIVVAAAFAPVIGWLRRHGFSAMLATWTTLIAGIAIFGGVITLIVFAVRNEWDDLSSSAVQGIDQVQGWLQSGSLPIDQQQLDSIRDTAVGFLTSSSFSSGALTGISVAADIATGAVLAIVVLFYLLKDGDRIWRFALRPFHGRNLDRGHRIGDVALKSLGGYVRGTALIAFVDAAGIFIGLLVIQVPLALPLAVIVFIGAFIPIVGATVAGILAALVALVANGPVAALLVVGVVIVVNQLEGNFLQPVVQGRSLKLHPLVILLALTAGTILGGILGAVLSVPIAAVTWSIIKAWNPPDEAAPAFAEPSIPEKAELQEAAAAKALKKARKRGRSAPARP